MLGVQECIPLRHHSWSAPSRLLLDGCLSRVKSLSGQLDRVTNQVRDTRWLSLSVPDLSGSAASVVFHLLEDLMTEVVIGGSNMSGNVRQCHNCHRPLTHPDHVGIGSGVKQCTLGHYDLCPGGRKAGPDWTGCPAISTETSDVEGEGSTKTSADLKKVYDQESIKLDNVDTTSDPYSLVKSMLEEAGKSDQIVIDGGTDSSDDEEDKFLQSEIEKLKIQVESDEAKLKADKKEKKRLNRERLEKEKSELLKKAKAQQKLSHDHLQKKAADLAARQQQEAADRRAAMQTGSDNLTIGNLRSMPGASSEVDKLLAGLQALVPSLAKLPTAPSASGSTFQPLGVLSGQSVQGNEEYDTDFVFHPGRGKFVPVVHSPARAVGAGQQHQCSGGVKAVISDDDETSADEDCPVEPPSGYRHVWKRDDCGEKYFIQKKVKQLPEMVQTYVRDEDTGRWYKRNIPRTDLGKNQPAKTTSRKTAPALTSTSPVYADHRAGSSSPVPLVRRGLRTPVSSAPPSHADRVPGIVPIDPERQGRDNKIPDRLQWARNCPVNWTNKVTSANMNVVLWAWSYVAELLATRTGMAPNLEQGELEARLQHFCHVLEITLQTSGSADFCGDAWSVGRLYDKKVQQKVDSKMFSWVQLSSMNYGASLPHELIAATQELAKKKEGGGKVPGDGKKGNGDGKSKGGKKEKASWKCPTWNKSETRGKCNWELENAPDRCQGIHECSYCKAKSFTPVNHQRFFCKKRLEEEEG